MIFLVGPYRFQLPHWTEVKTKPLIPLVDNCGEGTTLWEFVLGAFSFHLHLENTGQPEDLRSFILSCTKKYVDLETVEINGVRGVRYGGYDMAGGCWIDWWMKKGEMMLCIALRSSSNHPSDEDRRAHQEVIESLTYSVS